MVENTLDFNKDLLYKSEYWRERAQAMRFLAEHMDDIQAKAIMMRIADDDDAIARRLDNLTAPPVASLEAVVSELRPLEMMDEMMDKEKKGDPL